MDISYRSIQESDLARIKSILDWYILHTTVTYYSEPIAFDQLKEVIYFDHPRYKSYLIMVDQHITGYCYLTHYKKRPAYHRSSEITLYLQHEHVHKGIGSHAIQYLEAKAKDVGLKTLIACISADNNSSIRLFEKSGYVKCAHFKNVGEKFDRVLDVVYYQKEI